MKPSIFKPTIALVATTATAVMLAMPMARAAVNQEDFQLDGDAYEATCGGALGTVSCDPGTLPLAGTTPTAVDDWDVLYNCPTSGSATVQCQRNDPGSGNLAVAIGDLVIDLPDADQFTQGSKDDQNVTAWSWTPNDGGSDKTNLYESFAAKYPAGSLYIGANRVINNGDANIGVWLLQNATQKCTTQMVTDGKCSKAGTFVGKADANGFSGPVSHRVGDILIVSAFTNGGTVANMQVYKVIQTVGHDSSTDAVAGVCPANAIPSQAGKNTGATGVCLQQMITGTNQGTALCNSQIGSIPAGVACAATNAAAVTALDKRFASPQNGAAPSTYPPLTFFEIGLNLASLNLASECFPSYLVDGRQSQSVTSALNDFTLGNFQNCDASVTTEIHLSSPPAGTDPNIDCNAQGVTCTPLDPGTSIYDKAFVAGTPGAQAPTGSVTFTWFKNQTCASTGTTIGPINLVDNGSTITYNSTTNIWTVKSTAVSGTSNVTSSGVSFKAHYDATVGGPYPSRDSACEKVTVKSAPTLTTTASGPVSLGVSINDVAHISGLAGSQPGGTITFTLYSTKSSATPPVCSGVLFTDSKPVSGNGDVSSSSYTPTAAGTYYWIASYSGDANNTPVSGSCGDSNESSVVQPAQPGVLTQPSAQVINNDSATLTGLVSGVAPTGSITFNLYQDATCSGAVKYTETVAVSNAGASTTNKTPIPVTSDTTFRWVVSYNGDANYQSAASLCSAESVAIDINPNPSP